MRNSRRRNEKATKDHDKAQHDAANTQDRIAADLAAKEIEAEIEARRQALLMIVVAQSPTKTLVL